MARSFFISTLGCPKNDVDSAKLAGRLRSQGYDEASYPGEADVVVVNTCAFIEPARAESIETILQMSELRRPGAQLAVTGCLAERHGEELAAALQEVDVVAGFGMDFGAFLSLDQLRAGAPETAAVRPAPVLLRARGDIPAFDLLELPRPPASAPWAYVKAAEGCDRRCGFCAIPSFRGRQRSRSMRSILSEIDTLAVKEVVLVAQDLASYGRDLSTSDARTGPEGEDIVQLVEAAAARVPIVRLLYLYPSSLTDRLIEAVCATGVPYFDLSLQHASGRLLRRMRRWGSAERFLERIARIRSVAPDAALRSSFILGYPGETEEDHDEILSFLKAAQLDWAGFFTFSPESGTHAAGLPDQVPGELATERLRECSELQDQITARRRNELVGATVSVLVDEPGVGRSYREAPEIDGVIRLPRRLVPGSIVTVKITEAAGPDLAAVPVSTTDEAATMGRR